MVTSVLTATLEKSTQEHQWTQPLPNSYYEEKGVLRSDMSFKPRYANGSVIGISI